MSDTDITVDPAQFLALRNAASRGDGLVEYEISQHFGNDETGEALFEIHRADFTKVGPHSGFKQVTKDCPDEAECLATITEKIQQDVADGKKVHVWIYDLNDEFPLDALYVPDEDGEVTRYVSRSGRAGHKPQKFERGPSVRTPRPAKTKPRKPPMTAHQHIAEMKQRHLKGAAALKAFNKQVAEYREEHPDVSQRDAQRAVKAMRE